VALDQPNHKNSIGWVKFDAAERLWRAACKGNRCNELGQASTKAGAAEIVREHYLIEHAR
jgi:hypothetical protein